jgi:hypothetical protein
MRTSNSTSKILPTISPFYGVNPSVGAVLEIFWIKETVPIYRRLHFNTNIGGGTLNWVWLCLFFVTQKLDKLLKKMTKILCHKKVFTMFLLQMYSLQK